MQNDIKIDDQLRVSGQPSAGDFEKISKNGIKSVLNLRATSEEGFLKDEAKQVEAAGLKYSNIPVDVGSINDNLTDQVPQEIKTLPKPSLIRCNSGMRAGAMAMMHMALENGCDGQKALQQAKELGFDCSQNPRLKECFESYFAKKSRKDKF